MVLSRLILPVSQTPAQSFKPKQNTRLYLQQNYYSLCRISRPIIVAAYQTSYSL